MTGRTINSEYKSSKISVTAEEISICVKIENIDSICSIRFVDKLYHKYSNASVISEFQNPLFYVLSSQNVS